MSDSRHADGRRARRDPASAKARPTGSSRFPAVGRVSLLAAAALLGATVTVVVLNHEPAPPRSSFAAPVSAEVDVESSLWKTRETVKGKARAENTPLELGLRFTANRDGEVAGVRFYKPASERGSHQGSLWSADRKRLAKVTFTGESRSGWQQALFEKPVPIAAGRTYTVSYHTADGGYVAAAGALDDPVTVGPLTAHAGVFAPAAKSAFPSRRHAKRVNYWVDVVFRHRERRHGTRPSHRPTEGVTTGPTATPTAGDPSTSPTQADPSVTPSTSPEGSRSPTASPSSTPSSSPSATRSSTPSPTPTRSRTPSPSVSPTLTPDPTKQPTKVPSATPKPTQPTTPPPAGGFPGAGDTGVPSGTTLKESKSITVTKDGTVIDGMEVTGEINVDADNVTIRNTRLAASPGEWGIIQRQGHTGLTVEDSEIFGNGKSRTQFGIINQGRDLTVRRVDIHTISNGILTEQGLIEDSYLHDPKYYSGDHTDMIMCTSGPPSGATLVIRNNTVINTLEQTGAIALFQDFGVVRNVTVEGNFLAGGGYSLYGGAGAKGTSSNIKVIGNVFSRDVWAKGGYNGPVAYWDKNGSGNEWKNNVWEDGKTVPEGG